MGRREGGRVPGHASRPRRRAGTRCGCRPRAPALDVGSAVSHVRAAPGDAGILRRDAPGRHAAAHRRGDRRPLSTRPDSTATLADDLRYTGRGVTTVEEHELWHMPIVLLLLVGAALRGMGVPPCRRPSVSGAGVAASARRRPAPSCRRRTSFSSPPPAAAESPSTKMAYDGRFAFVRLRYQGGFRGDPGWAHDYPRADWHFQRILEEVTLTRDLPRREQHPDAGRSGSDALSGRLHVRAGLLDA